MLRNCYWPFDKIILQVGQALEIFALYLAVGVLAGVIAGLFGLGGGIVIVPVLIATFSASGFPQEQLTHLAIATSLATIVVTSISAIVAHLKRNSLSGPLVFSMMPGVVAGAVLGGWLASQFGGSLLQICFGVFLIFIALQMVSGKVPAGSEQGHRKLPGLIRRSGIAGVIGCLSGIFGIGGGSLTVPFFSWYRVPMPQAVASASALGLPIALSATLTYIVTGWQQVNLPAGAYGYVYLPAFCGVVLTSIPFARVGAGLAHRLPEAGLRRVFAALSLLLGLRFIIVNIGV